jgi:hypothetical protein
MALSLVRRNESEQSLAAVTLDAIGEVGALVDKYLYLTSSEARDVLVLWTLHAHAIPFLDTSPRLSIASSEYGSGKTRVLEVLEQLTPNAEMATNVTPAVLWRLMEEHDVTTIMIDEADTVFGRMGSGSARTELRAVINAGYRRGGTVTRPKGGHDGGVAKFDVFGPLVLAGVGRLPDSLRDRAIEIPMVKAPPGVALAQFRITEYEREATDAREALRRWSHIAARYVAIVCPELPHDIVNRDADVWEPLFKVAELAGPEWQKRCRRACLAFTRGLDPQSELIRDIADVMGDAERMFTADLLEGLYALPGGKWTESVLTARALAKALDRYGVPSPRNIRIGNDTKKGYLRRDLESAFAEVL